MKKPNNFLQAVLCILASLLMGCQDAAGPSRISKMVDKINSKCPVLVDEETLLKKVDYDQKYTITYIYHLVHVSAVQVDTSAFRKALWPGLLANIKVDRELEDLRQGGYSFVYDYRDKDGKPVYSFLISEAHYNAPADSLK